jgi:2-haloacid dehalogenase
MPTAIDTFVFDLGNVLIHWDPRHVYRHLFADEAEMERFLAEVCNHDWNIQMDAGRPFADGIRELTGRYPELAHLIRAYRERWPEMLAGPITGTVELLSRLHKDGRRLFALTNWSHETFPIARERYDFLGWFRHIAVSGELGLVKPDPAIFRHLIATCAIDPARTLFIDDALANIQTAGRMGFATHHFREPNLLETQLNDWGLLPD